MAKKKTSKKIRSILQQVCHSDAAGIDLGATEFYAAIGREAAAAAGESHCVRRFDSFNQGIAEAVVWLQSHGVRTVAMESTGNYWVALYDRLCAAGLTVFLVNAAHCKALPGRKTDVCDAQWLQQLHTAGLLKASYVPEERFRPIRYLARHRETLIADAARELQHIQKALIEMNVHLHHAVSDIDGLSGRTILEAILAGERDPEVLADLRHPGCRTPRKKIVAALDGNFRDEYLFAMGLAYERWGQLRGQIERTERRLAQMLESCPGLARADEPEAGTDRQDRPEGGHPAGRVYGLEPETSRKPSRKHPLLVDFVAESERFYGVDLSRIPGVSSGVLGCLIAEIGGREHFLAHFPSAGRFCSWLGLCPDNRITGGKIKRTKTRKVAHALARALRMAAMTLWRSQTHLGDFSRKMKARLGKPEGITATAHKVARIIHAMILKGCAYDPSIGEAATEINLKKQIANLRRKAEKLGFTLSDPTPFEA